jgi:hypothetical protein
MRKKSSAAKSRFSGAFLSNRRTLNPRNTYTVDRHIKTMDKKFIISRANPDTARPTRTVYPPSLLSVNGRMVQADPTILALCSLLGPVCAFSQPHSIVSVRIRQRSSLCLLIHRAGKL